MQWDKKYTQQMRKKKHIKTFYAYLLKELFLHYPNFERLTS